ncbi:glutaredoxin [bacterium]|jgi:cytochrome c biogenesis protein CcdA|nr:glutaredoxin [bacterium]
MKKFFRTFLLPLVAVLSLSVSGFAANQTSSQELLVEVLERPECQHCQAQKEFLMDLKTDYPNLQINYYEVNQHPQLWQEVTGLSGVISATPITIIGGSLVQGFDSAETTGRLYRDILSSGNANSVSLREYLDSNLHDKVQAGGAGCADDSGACGVERQYEPFYVKLPFLPSFDVKKYSLPVMSFLLGAIDGFNPCAMWVLVTFILVLAKIGNRRKLIEVVALFLVAQAIMYALILNVWIGVWDFVGLDAIITPIIGAVAIGAGSFFLWEFFQVGAECKVTDSNKRKETKSKIEKIATAKLTIVSALAIIGLALSVNVINFACSIGIPQVFTKILELNLVGFWGRQFYVGLYILAFLLDDLLVFVLALWSLNKLGFTSKYSKASNLIGGLVMLALGSIMLFKPELLVLI